jgi:hypothetical protein
MVLLSLISRLHVISILHTILCFNELLGLAAMITTALYRLQFSGRYCSCVGASPYCDHDFVYDPDDEELDIGLRNIGQRDRSRLLIRRGRMLLALLITYWIFMIFNLLMHTISVRKSSSVVA